LVNFKLQKYSLTLEAGSVKFQKMKEAPKQFTRRQFLFLGGLAAGGAALTAWGVSTPDDEEHRRLNQTQEERRKLGEELSGDHVVVPNGLFGQVVLKPEDPRLKEADKLNLSLYETNEQIMKSVGERLRPVAGWVGVAFMIVPSLRILNLTLNSAIEDPREIPPEDK